MNPEMPSYRHLVKFCGETGQPHGEGSMIIALTRNPQTLNPSVVANDNEMCLRCIMVGTEADARSAYEDRVPRLCTSRHGIFSRFLTHAAWVLSCFCVVGSIVFSCPC